MMVWQRLQSYFGSNDTVERRRSGCSTATTLVAAVALTATVATSSGCRNNQEPSLPGAPYLAIVAKFDAGPGVDVGHSYTYHVQELSGTVGIDTFVTVAPTDTVILSVSPATYVVTLEGVPSKCISQYGLSQSLIVPAKSNTTIARYFVVCRPLIQLIATIEGANRDREYIYRVSGAAERVGVLRMDAEAVTADTVLLEDLPPGSYEVELFNVADNCAVISPGAEHPRAEVTEEGGAQVTLRVACSDPARQPKVLTLQGTYRSGVSGMVFTAADPTRDVAEYIWDVTDCRGASALPSGPRSMRGLQSERTAFRDTITVVTAFETGLLDADLTGRCVAVRLVDNEGNTTPLAETPLRPSTDPQLDIATFQAQFDPALTTLTIDLALGAPADRFLGAFPTLRMRDGVFGQADGNQDIGLYTRVGFLDTNFPPVFAGARFQYYDVLAVELYLFDRNANFMLLRDEQLF